MQCGAEWPVSKYRQCAVPQLLAMRARPGAILPRSSCERLVGPRVMASCGGFPLSWATKVDGMVYLSGE